MARYHYTNSSGEHIATKLRMDPKAFLWRKPDGNWGPVERLPDLQLAHKPTIQTESYGEDLSKFQFADDTLRTARSRFRRALRANNYNQFNTL